MIVLAVLASSLLVSAKEYVLPLKHKTNYAPSLVDLLSPVQLKYGVSLLSTKKRGLLGIDLNLGGLIGVDLDIGKGLDLGIDLLGINLNLGVLTDTKWDNTPTNRLINSKSDNAWFTEISFGSPPQTLVIDIDSGSADTVIFDTTCATCGEHARFDRSESSSYTRTAVTFGTEYGDGTQLTGMIGKDTTHFTSSLFTKGQMLALITDRKGPTTSAWDGVLGIGPDQLSFVENNVTPLSNLVKAGKLTQPLVGVLLIKETATSQGGGEYRWGGINKAYVKGSIVYTPVTSSYYWGLDLPGIYVNNQAMHSQSAPGRAIVDTGTTLVYVSDFAAKNIHSKVPGSTVISRVYYVPCNTVRSPNVFFEIQGHRWGIPASDLAFRASGKDDGLCISGIQGGAEEFVILGDVFIKNHYLVLNYGNSKKYDLSIGLANRTDIPLML